MNVTRLVDHIDGMCHLADQTNALTDEQFADISPHLTPGVREVLSVEGSITSRSGRGGTSLDRVSEQLGEVRAVVAEHRAWLG